MRYAVIKTGGKQYVVEEGQVLSVEVLDVEEGKELQFDEVLLTVDNEDVTVGTPLVEGAVVSAKLVEHGKGKKVRGLKYKRGGHRTKFGHRQPYSEIQITQINHG